MSSTKKIGKNHKINHKNNLVENIFGKKINTINIKLKYAKIHINVGTGHLTHFKSAPGLSNILHLLNTNKPIKKITHTNKNDNIYFKTIFIKNNIKNISTILYI